MDSAQGPITSEPEQAHTRPQFGASTALSEKLLAVAIRAQNFTGSTGVAIALTEGQDMVCRANWGTSAPEVGTRLSLEHSFTGLCVRTGEPLRCDDAQADPRVDPEACQALGISAIATAPIRRGLKVIGVIAAFSDTPKAFTEKHLLILTTLSEVIVELLDNPDPANQLSPLVQTAPGLPRAAAVVQAPFTPPVDRTTVDKTTISTGYEDADPLQDYSAPLAASIEPAQSKAQPLIPMSEPAVSAVASPAVTPLTTVASPVIPIRTTPAPSKDFGNAARLGSTSAADILPAAMDPGPQQQSKAAISTPSLRRIAPRSDTESGTLTFGSVNAASSPRRWIIPAAVLAAIIIGLGTWRLISARRAKQAPVAAVQELPAAVQPQSPQPPQDLKSSQATVSEPNHSRFSPPPFAEASPPKIKPARVEADDVTVRHVKEPVVEAAGPVRRLEKVSGTQVSEAPPPQLALSTPDLPTALSKPVPAAVTPPVSRVLAAQLLSRVEPVYPDAARRLRVSGKVVVKATITRNGTVGNVRWVSGNDLFRDATVTAVKQWRYKPATLNGQPVESDLEIVLQFNRPS
jgi:TonB family protein